MLHEEGETAMNEMKPARRPFSAQTMNRVLDLSNTAYISIIKRQQRLEEQWLEEKGRSPTRGRWFVWFGHHDQAKKKA